MSIKATVITLLASFNVVAQPPVAISASVPPHQVSQQELHQPQITPLLDDTYQANRKVIYQCEDTTEKCWTQQEKDAAIFTELKTLFMVGALKCRHDDKFNTVKSYNLFVTSNLELIKDSQAIAISHFAKQTPENPKLGDRKYDQFLTRLANLYSLASSYTPMTVYCANIGQRFELLQKYGPSPNGMIKASYDLTGHSKP